VYINQSQRVIF